MEINQIAVDTWQHPDSRVLCPLTDQEVAERTAADWMDRIEGWGSRQPQVDCPLEHVFTPGIRPGEWIYRRTIFMRRGLLITSKIHRTEHQFFVSKGKCHVWSPDGSMQTIEAGYIGITPAGTRRILLIEEDTIWSTIHPTESQDLRLIEDQVIAPHDFNAGKALSEGEMIGLVAEKSGSLRDALSKLLTH